MLTVSQTEHVDMHDMLPWAPSMQDNSAVGIRATIARLNSMLQASDPELWAHLEQKNKVKGDTHTKDLQQSLHIPSALGNFLTYSLCVKLISMMVDSFLWPCWHLWGVT